MTPERSDQHPAPAFPRCWALLELVVVAAFAAGVVAAMVLGSDGWMICGGMIIVLGYVAVVQGRRGSTSTGALLLDIVGRIPRRVPSDGDLGERDGDRQSSESA